MTWIKDSSACDAMVKKILELPVAIVMDTAMHNIITASSKTAAIADLHPTQITVGMREVAFKRKRWREKDRETAERYLTSHAIPVILGPEARYFLLDRHHLSRALHIEGVTEAPISVVADLSNLPPDEFWSVFEGRNWSHPFDDKGKRRDYRDIPKLVVDLIDDPFRSLAGALKRAGCYAKDKSPFSEFRWADFLRDRIRARNHRA